MSTPDPNGSAVLLLCKILSCILGTSGAIQNEQEPEQALYPHLLFAVAREGEGCVSRQIRFWVLPKCQLLVSQGRHWDANEHRCA